MSQYNEKLFSGGWRTRLHHMRFHWLRRHLPDSPGSFTLFELGCFDCRSLQHIPKPSHYVGADAGWEGGLNDAQMTFGTRNDMELVHASTSLDLARFQEQKFDYTIALETLEHIPDGLLIGYIEFLAKVTGKRCFISVPVEVGPVFLAKHIAKKLGPNLQNGETEAYTLREVYWATRGRASHVKRFEHKGFDYRQLLETLRRYFVIEAIEGLPFTAYPFLSFQVGIIASPKSPV
jgi:hypothetical protein